MKDELLQLNVRRKTTRAALSGVDLYDSACQLLIRHYGFQPVQLDLQFYRFMYCNPMVSLSSGEEPPTLPPWAAFRFQTRDVKQALHFFEGRTPPESVYDFDEGDITRFCEMHGERLVFTGPAHHSPIQIFATMSKTLFGNLALGDPQGLTLARIQLGEPILAGADKSLQCEVKFKFAGMKGFNLSMISIHNKPVGSLTWACISS